MNESINVLSVEEIRLRLENALDREPTKAEVARTFDECLDTLRNDQVIKDRIALLTGELIKDYASWEVDES